MELLLLLVILPAVQDQNHTREWLKNAIRAWCSVAAWILNLKSYLFGDTNDDVVDEATEAIDDEDDQGNGNEEQHIENQNNDQQNNQPDLNPDPVQQQVPPVRQLRDLPPPPVPNQDGLAAAHQALLQREGPVGFQPFKKPRMFPLLVSNILLFTVVHMVLGQNSQYISLDVNFA